MKWGNGGKTHLFRKMLQDISLEIGPSLVEPVNCVFGMYFGGGN